MERISGQLLYVELKGTDVRCTTVTFLSECLGLIVIVEVSYEVRAEPDYEPPEKPEELLSLVKNISYLHKAPEWVIELLEILLEKKDQ